MALAKKHRMNTEIRRSIFAILLSSEDYIDAFQKINKLGLKGQQERDVVTVLMYCCGQEKTFNPYYAHLSMKLCAFRKSYWFTFQTSFWDEWKRFEEETLLPRAVSNLAHLLAQLVGNMVMPLAALKSAEFESLPAKGVLFFRVFFEDFLTLFDEDAVTQVVNKLAGKRDDYALIKLKEGISLFFVQGLAVPKKPSNDKERLLKERVHLAQHILLESASSDLF